MAKLISTDTLAVFKGLLDANIDEKIRNAPTTPTTIDYTVDAKDLASYSDVAKLFDLGMTDIDGTYHIVATDEDIAAVFNGGTI